VEIRRQLDTLVRAPCETQALDNLAMALDGADLRRDAAKARVSFSRRCKGHWGFLLLAADRYFELADYSATVDVAEDVIAQAAHNSMGYFLRGRALAKLEQHGKAVDDLVTTIELIGHKEHNSSAAYVALAKSYDALGQHCDAADVIESWVAINPGRNDTPRMRASIRKYAEKESCSTNSTGDRDEYPAPTFGAVVVIPIQINGVRARFVVDTSASFVSLTRRLATEAGVDVDDGSYVMLRTANGIASAKRGRVREIKLRSIASTKVPVIVQDLEAGYGPGVDGLLGMSFLSRFDVSLSGGSLRIAQKSR
jgi:aspartyl protease family protein